MHSILGSSKEGVYPQHSQVVTTFPALAIMISVAAINLFGDRLDGGYDPRLE